MKTNIRLIQLFTNNDILRQYAVWLKLKRVHSNGRVYDYTTYKFSKQSGMSRNSIKKYIQFFIDNGWAKIEGKDLQFVSHDKLKKVYGIKLKHNIKIKNQNITKIVNSLRYELLKLKQSQFKYLKQIRKDQFNPLRKGALARHKKADKFPRLTGEFSKYLKVSLKKLALLINKSASTVSLLIKTKKAKVMPGKRFLVKFKRNIHLPHNMYWSKGNVVRCESNSYIF